MLDLVEEAFDEVATAIEGLAESRDVPAVWYGLDAGPCSTNDQGCAQMIAVIGPVAEQDIAHGAPVRSRQKMPFRTRRSSTRGTPRTHVGSKGWITDHSKSVRLKTRRDGLLSGERIATLVIAKSTSWVCDLGDVIVALDDSRIVGAGLLVPGVSSQYAILDDGKTQGLAEYGLRIWRVVAILTD